MRTGIGMAAVVFYGVLWAEGANDVLADFLQVPLYTITWISRVLIFVGPVLAYIITKRICLALQRKDAGMLLHGYESGIIRQMPDGEFIEVHKPVNEEGRAVLEAKKVLALLPAPGAEDLNGVPAPTSRGLMGRARAAANRAFAETIPPETNGHGPEITDGHGTATLRRSRVRSARQSVRRVPPPNCPTATRPSPRYERVLVTCRHRAAAARRSPTSKQDARPGRREYRPGAWRGRAVRVVRRAHP